MIRLIIILISSFLIVSCDQNTSSNSSGGSKTLTSYTYITMMDKGISANGIWGTRCNYSDGSYREIKSSDPGGPPPRC
tara:strand:- start:315 stop:548 length:234 start_codon:yes stop_codon:yes gene_type:complete